MMKISVIVPSYKPGGYLWECLDSLKQQTLYSAAFEVIIVLNGCCEPWKSQISDYIKANKLTNFRLLQTNEGGVSNARNIGIDNAKGEYITFIDDDDYVSHHYLEALLEKAAPLTAVVTDSRAFKDGENAWIETYKPHVTYNRFNAIDNCSLFRARAFFNGPCMKLLNRNSMQDIRFNTAFYLGEDSLFMFEISKNIKTLAFANPEAIYYRRFRPQSAYTTSRTRIWKIVHSTRMLYNFCQSYIKAPISYNFALFLSRCLASIKTAIN